MIFSFTYPNLPLGELRALPDLVLPVADGLIENGHHVMRFSSALWPAPVINVLVEQFTDDALTEELLKARAEHGIRFGLLCGDDIGDATAAEGGTSRRGANLRRLLPVADFVWTVLPQVAALEAAGAQGSVALVRLGFSPRALNPDLVPEPGLRGFDAVLYGDGTPYRLAVVDELRRRNIACFCLDQASSPPLSWRAMPPQLAGDILSRAKVVIDLAEGPGRRFEAPTRLSRALHNGVVTVSEQLAAGAAPDLQRYTAAVPYAGIADQCQRIIESGMFAELGMAALAKFRQETSMRDSMAAALRLPAFARLAGS